MDRNGIIEHCKHKWMVPFLRSMPAAMADKHINKFLQAYPVHIEMPLQQFDWVEFISQAKLFFNINFMPFLLLACGGMCAFHYQKILVKVGKDTRSQVASLACI